MSDSSIHLWLSARENAENRKLGDILDIDSSDAGIPLGEFCAKEACELYNKTLMTSIMENDSQQIYYHAINVAFMSLVHLKDRVFMKKSATTALQHATRAIEESGNNEDYWAVATRRKRIFT